MLVWQRGQPGHMEHEVVGAERNSAKAREERLARMLDAEDAMLDRASQLIDAFMAFHEVAPDATEPPPHWISEFGLEGARQRLEVAKRGWANAGEMPGGVKLAQMTYVGIQKARGRSSSIRAHNLNVAIQLPAPTSADHPGAVNYPTLEIE